MFNLCLNCFIDKPRIPSLVECINISVLALIISRNTLVLNCIYTAKNDTWHHRQTLQSFIAAECHAECMPHTFNTAGIHNIGFLDIQFSSSCHSKFYVQRL